MNPFITIIPCCIIRPFLIIRIYEYTVIDFGCFSVNFVGQRLGLEIDRFLDDLLLLLYLDDLLLEEELDSERLVLYFELVSESVLEDDEYLFL